MAEIERELDTAIYPGTEIMIDLPSHHFVKSSASGVLVPQPSDNKHDPLVRPIISKSPDMKELLITAI